MHERRVYLDNHATTRVDPRVVEAMLPFWTETYGNPASTSHVFGWEAKDAVDDARTRIAAAIGAARARSFSPAAPPKVTIWQFGALPNATDGATVISFRSRPSIRPCSIHSPGSLGGASKSRFWASSRHPARTPDGSIPRHWRRRPRRHVARLGDAGQQRDRRCAAAGRHWPDLPRARGFAALRRHASRGPNAGQRRGIGVDLLSFSAHKLYGPKGVGALYVRQGADPVRLECQIAGGGHERGLRSGTLNVPGIVGFAYALDLCLAEMPGETVRLAGLRNRLFAGLTAAMNGVTLNGPALDAAGLRLPGNLNASFASVDGEALIMNVKQLAVSSGSACTSANPEPSHVLAALGLGDDAVRSSLRFGLGRFNTAEEIEFSVLVVAEVVERLRKLSSLA